MNAKTLLDKIYDPKPAEERWGKFWLESGIFTAEAESSKPKFSMVIPPPNVTGHLHIGHALCFTLPDIICRWRRMKGFNVLWLPGTDHASIAVHNVIEQSLAQQGLTREKLGREEFLKRAWEWKNKYWGIITGQLKKLGASLDWSRERFTMDEGFSRAVRKVFVDLYGQGLIYRDYFLVNRCPHCGTVLSDIEIEHREHQSKLYTIRYRMENSEEWVEVATTRPETMLGDTALAVHPDDPRFARLHGRRAVLPLVGRLIPIITDEKVEKDFGTGAVKVTPAHDPVDFELGRKHGLEQVIVIDGAGRMTEAAGVDFQGLDRFEAREKVLDRLREQGYLVKGEDYTHAVGHCCRCKTVIEPNLSWQWFVRIAPLAQEAIRAVEDGRIEFVPSNWTKIYFEWMYNIHDWCISRQLWWGHRIPAWHCQECGAVTVAMDAPSACPKCGSGKVEQDPDVLDTWFSSALWPFGTLGWPEDTADLRTFYPTDLMFTAYDIIFFWVARMIMMGLKFMGRIPFRQVYLNGLVRDLKRRKMSKSEGNVIDPQEMIDKYGTDALRFTLAAQAVPGMDLSLSEERMAGYRAFANKIWNASRFVLMSIGPDAPAAAGGRPSLADLWIRSRLARVIDDLEEALESFRFYEAADRVYHFIWDEFCDWYIELAKSDLKVPGGATPAVLQSTLDAILRILHPFMPFITEEIWHHLPGAGLSLALAEFPAPRPEWKSEAVESEMAVLQEVIAQARTIRTENKIPPHRKVSLWLRPLPGADPSALDGRQDYVLSLANLSALTLMDNFPDGQPLLKGLGGGFELAIPQDEELDAAQERLRLEKDLGKIEAEINKLAQRLATASFVEKAPQAVVEEVRARLQELEQKKTKTKEHLGQIFGVK